MGRAAQELGSGGGPDRGGARRSRGAAPGGARAGRSALPHHIQQGQCAGCAAAAAAARPHCRRLGRRGPILSAPPSRAPAMESLSRGAASGTWARRVPQALGKAFPLQAAALPTPWPSQCKTLSTPSLCANAAGIPARLPFSPFLPPQTAVPCGSGAFHIAAGHPRPRGAGRPHIWGPWALPCRQRVHMACAAMYCLCCHAWLVKPLRFRAPCLA
jgi:hypothetical protein